VNCRLAEHCPQLQGLGGFAQQLDAFGQEFGIPAIFGRGSQQDALVGLSGHAAQDGNAGFVG
jgi:hypothetical protein